MKKILALCLASSVLGAAVAVVCTDLAETTPTTAAQEPRFDGLKGTDAAPKAGITARGATAGSQTSPGQPSTGYDDLTPEEQVNIAVYENTNHSVAHITTRSVRTDGFFWMEIPSEGEGSGVVLDQQGHVLTNYHVVEGAREIRVTLFDGKSYDGRPIGGDVTSDVAVLKIDAPAETLHPIVFGDSTRLRVGQRVYAIGNPFGLERTLTTGIISSLNRTLPSRSKYRTMEQIIQTDASINPGSSGGPLLDSRGRMIGMNTAIFNKTGADVGVGFAIPVNTIARVVPQLIQDGRVIRPDIGITQVYELEQGLLILTMTGGGAAEKAGLRGPRIFRRRGEPFTYIDRSAADLIVAVDGTETPTVEEFLSIVESKQPGDRVVVTVIRDGQKENVPVVLEAGE